MNNELRTTNYEPVKTNPIYGEPVEPSVVSKVEPPVVSKVEPPVVSKVEPPVVSKVEPPVVPALRSPDGVYRDEEGSNRSASNPFMAAGKAGNIRVKYNEIKTSNIKGL